MYYSETNNLNLERGYRFDNAFIKCFEENKQYIIEHPSLVLKLEALTMNEYPVVATIWNKMKSNDKYFFSDFLLYVKQVKNQIGQEHFEYGTVEEKVCKLLLYMNCSILKSIEFDQLIYDFCNSKFSLTKSDITNYTIEFMENHESIIKYTIHSGDKLVDCYMEYEYAPRTKFIWEISNISEQSFVLMFINTNISDNKIRFKVYSKIVLNANSTFKYITKLYDQHNFFYIYVIQFDNYKIKTVYICEGFYGVMKK